MKSKLLPLDAKVALVSKMVDDLAFYKQQGFQHVPNRQQFRFISRDEDRSIRRSARGAALIGLDKGKSLVKNAFDTRRVNQESEANPRRNLQKWHRSEPFISQEDSIRLKTFAKLAKVVSELKMALGTEPEWHDSYVRLLDNNLHKVLRIKQADGDVHQSQLNYLEQLMYARYRLTMNDIASMNERELKEAVMSKDESLMKRGDYLNVAQMESRGSPSEQPHIIKVDHSSPTVGLDAQKALLAALFGEDSLRKDGEKSVERTITITIKESAGK